MSEARPGFGTRHPLVAAAIATSEPLESLETAWLDGTLPLRLTGYLDRPDLPDEVTLSVRCIVRVEASFVMCTSADGSHGWPGGRREAGESHEDTAIREVHEETGWMLERDSIRYLGWLHWEQLSPMPEDHPWPYPDFIQVVYTARATTRAAEEWTDTEGYELTSSLVTMDEASAAFPDNTVCLAMMRAAPICRQ